MGFIKLTGVVFNPAPISAKVLTIKHRLTSDPDLPANYITDSVNVQANIDGSFVAPFWILNLLNGTSYTVKINTNCGAFTFQKVFTTPCNCSVGFTPIGDSSRCQKVETTAPIITRTDYCLAVSRNGAYASRFARIYNPAFSNNSIAMISAPPAEVYAQMTLAPYWANPTANINLGVVNRHSVWIDSNCDGTKNALAAGEKTTLSFAFNAATTRRVHVLVASDNQFELKHNGSLIANTTVPNSQENFKIAHIFPVEIIVGMNYFNVVATGDGTVNDAVAMLVFDNTAEQVKNAVQDSDLTILFKSSDLIGQHIDVAYCQPTYSLDTTGGQGNYTCKRITYEDCLSDEEEA